MVNVSPRNFQIEPQLWRSGNGSRYAGVCEVQIYMKEETKKGLYLKFQRNRSIRSPPTMRVFVCFGKNGCFAVVDFLVREKVYAL